MSIVQTIGRTVIGLPKVQRSEIAATLLDQVRNTTPATPPPFLFERVGNRN